MTCLLWFVVLSVVFTKCQFIHRLPPRNQPAKKSVIRQASQWTGNCIKSTCYEPLDSPSLPTNEEYWHELAISSNLLPKLNYDKLAPLYKGLKSSSLLAGECSYDTFVKCLYVGMNKSRMFYTKYYFFYYYYYCCCCGCYYSCVVRGVCGNVPLVSM